MQPLIHIIDDDAGLRAALGGLFRSMDYETSEHPSIQTFLAAGRTDRPGCVIVDVRLPDGNGLDLQGRMSSLGMAQPVIVMTGYGDIPMSVRAMKAGAVDFLTKPIRDQDLFEAVLAAIALDQERLTARSDLEDLQRRHDSLSPRERQVAALVVSGYLNKQIAGELGLSEATVKTHRRAALRKMGAATIADFVRAFDRLARTSALAA